MDTLLLSLIIFSTFLGAGAVKGLIGLGLPTISIAILSNFLPLPMAIQLMVVPGFATNIWQALEGEYLVSLLIRLWLFLLASVIFAWLAYRYVLLSYPKEMTILLGVLLCVYAISGLGLKLPRINARHEKLSAPILGAATGFIAGTTGNTTMPSVAFLESLGLNRDQMVQAMGLVFGAPLLTIAIVSLNAQTTTSSMTWVSFFSLAPAFLGMWLGRKFRTRISEHLFRKLLFLGLLVMGIRLLVVNIYS